jgi:hypothetical protein
MPVYSDLILAQQNLYHGHPDSSELFWNICKKYLKELLQEVPIEVTKFEKNQEHRIFVPS